MFLLQDEDHRGAGGLAAEAAPVRGGAAGHRHAHHVRLRLRRSGRSQQKQGSLEQCKCWDKASEHYLLFISALTIKVLTLLTIVVSVQLQERRHALHQHRVGARGPDGGPGGRPNIR